METLQADTDTREDEQQPGIDLDEPLELLTPAEYAFAEHWLKNRNQIKAYVHSFPGTGQLKAKKLAPAVFRKPSVQREIRRIYHRWVDHSALQLSRVESELSRIGLSDFRRAFRPDGTMLLPHEIDPDTAAAVSSYTETEDTRTKKITRRIRFFDKGQSLRTLLEMRGALSAPDKGKDIDKPKAVFHFHIAGMPSKALAGSVTLAQPAALPDGSMLALPAPGQRLAGPRAAKRAKLQRGAQAGRRSAGKPAPGSDRMTPSPATAPDRAAGALQAVGISPDQGKTGRGKGKTRDNDDIPTDSGGGQARRKGGLFNERNS